MKAKTQNGLIVYRTWKSDGTRRPVSLENAARALRQFSPDEEIPLMKLSQITGLLKRYSVLETRTAIYSADPDYTLLDWQRKKRRHPSEVREESNARA